MNVLILYPNNKNAITGNLCSALQYQKILQHLGHSVEVSSEYTGQRSEVLIVINAAKKNSDIRKFKVNNPNSKIVSVLSGTDIYPVVDTAGRVVGVVTEQSIVNVVELLDETQGG